MLLSRVSARFISFLLLFSFCKYDYSYADSTNGYCSPIISNVAGSVILQINCTNNMTEFRQTVQESLQILDRRIDFMKQFQIDWMLENVRNYARKPTAQNWRLALESMRQNKDLINAALQAIIAYRMHISKMGIADESNLLDDIKARITAIDTEINIVEPPPPDGAEAWIRNYIQIINSTRDDLSKLMKSSKVNIYDLEVMWPVFGEIKTHFADETCTRNGILISVPEMTSVRASIAGQVVFVGRLKAYGLTIIEKSSVFDENRDQRTINLVYSFLSDASVKQGDPVGQNEVIGRSGKTLNGDSALSFAIFKEIDNKFKCVDPEREIKYPILDIESK